MTSSIYKDIEFRDFSFAELSKIFGELSESALKALDTIDKRSLKAPRKGRLYAGWMAGRQTETYFPDLLILPSEAKGDFFAWSLSFLPQTVPLTSLLRVLDWDEWTDLTERKERDISRDFSSLAAIIFGEIASDSSDTETIMRMNLSAFDSSCSAALSQVFALGGNWDSMVKTAQKWTEARNLVGMAKRNLATSEILRIWFIMTLHYRVDGTHLGSEEDLIIAEICQSLHWNGNYPQFLVGKLLGKDRSSENLFEEPRGDIESRILNLEKLGRFLVSTNVDPFIGAFLFGSSASLVAPGQTRHLDYVRRWLTVFPSVVMWYVICSSIHSKSRILSERAFLCLRIGKKILEDFRHSANPGCDVSLDELKTMNKNEGAQFPIRLLSGGVMRVELSPLVLATVRPNAGEDRQLELFARQEAARIKEESQSLNRADARKSLEALRYELDRLQRIIQGGEDYPIRKNR